MARGSKRKFIIKEESDPIIEEEPDLISEEDSDEKNSDLKPLLDSQRKKGRKVINNDELRLLNPIPANEARERWPLRYQDQPRSQSSTETLYDSAEEIVQAKYHYANAMVDSCLYKLGDTAYVQAEEGKPHYIARIVELFQTIDKQAYFKAQWFYRAEDTVINEENAALIDKRRVFLSDMHDDNPLNCIVSKVEIAQIDLVVKERTIPQSGFYCDMKYSLPYLTFKNIFHGGCFKGSNNNSSKPQKLLLDLYSGCGAMSIGICMGASLAGVDLVTVRKEGAEDFLCLIKKWQKLCKKFSLLDDQDDSGETSDEEIDDGQGCTVSEQEDGEDDEGSEEVYEVEKIFDICFGDPNKRKERGLYFKVHWKGYDQTYETWEPIRNLSNCKEKLKDFVRKGHKSNILPLPGSVYFICGGPPCQGVSGYNRYRNEKAPLDDEKNKQLMVFMDTIEHLQPRYILMENVVDILKFAKGFLGRYAIGRLVSMNYQTRMGMMAAGSYGVPQCRVRVFLWGAHPSEKIPQYPFPTHEVVSRGLNPKEFEEINVVHGKKDYRLEKALNLGDAISDLPQVGNDEKDKEREYGTVACTGFQKYIRLPRKDVIKLTVDSRHKSSGMLYDHQSLRLNADDYERVGYIPKKKGANFRDLPGVLVNEDNRAELDPTQERKRVKSGKPLVPDYAIKFVKGKSTKPFGRLWMDEIVNTVVTRAEPHNQIIIHPSQDRVLTIRENARLQGFPDCYKLFGTIKERYIQVGNAVAFPVSIALGYAFGLACQGKSQDDEPLMTLPFKFPQCLARSSDDDN
ncbi:hypothetical protein CCACVL1_13645 [Corchorus capsularis]|uniref:DNA (cytosine-5-)-methyltransferase n=1 Tax=Corchorus capsularis TaxID=210143 RepID=A0A1R3IA76_COCAP|nr:hypothetical protein CCACVL1_13645 [Corchorus capsularis]